MGAGIVEEEEKLSIEITTMMVTTVLSELEARGGLAPAISFVTGAGRKKLFTIEPKTVHLESYLSSLKASHRSVVDTRSHAAGKSAKKEEKARAKEAKVNKPVLIFLAFNHEVSRFAPLLTGQHRARRFSTNRGAVSSRGPRPFY